MQLFLYIQPNSGFQCEWEANLHTDIEKLILINICLVLVGWLDFLWHINLCRLFNAKSIFM